ncbi:hypothetical protein BZG01_07650 [Labilibaculum manganireducens]|uniref:Uncharacterized protein n=1 Tax=Labilibaculum manganireducens TaxID=1940525 RepID=A0A2N3IB94_9BACT|nr:hypothetical protein BZG01_07650 [Labilibaculum manganireducens]
MKINALILFSIFICLLFVFQLPYGTYHAGNNHLPVCQNTLAWTFHMIIILSFCHIACPELVSGELTTPGIIIFLYVKIPWHGRFIFF